MDGFRFDLMGLLDVELMNRIQQALDARFGNGEKQVYGEPWSAASTEVRPGTALGDKAHIRDMAPYIGAFCDNTRDAVKGGLDLMAKGIVNGGGLDSDLLAQCIGGWTRGQDANYAAPYQTITYLSCHDDWTLWDKLVYTMDPKQQFRLLQPEILRANRMAAAISFCCQGHVFFLSGEEFGRTKDGVKNSFKSSPEINRLDWTRAWENRDLVDWYRGLIALRMQLPGLQDKSASAADRITAVTTPAPQCAAVSLVNGGTWNTLHLLFNGSTAAQQIPLPAGQWQILADAESTFRWQAPVSVSGSVTLPPISVLILGEQNG